MRTDCDSCGTRFDSEAREDSARSIEGYSFRGPPLVLHSECQACEALGQAPPECPTDGCSGKLEGNDYNNDPVFTCSMCDATFQPVTLRQLLLGRAVERIVREHPENGRSAEGWALIVRAARLLGVIRG